jgi:hypothetical protein
MKKMITLSAILTLTLTTLANAGSLGGVGGGGGGTLPTNPVGPWEVEYIAKETFAKLFLRLFYNQLEGGALSSEPAVHEKLFGGKETIHHAIKKTGIYIADKTPCYDAYGNPKDGSIHSPVPNTICISSFTISQKIPKSEAFPQIFSLIAHEYSHLVGATEDEADSIQRFAVVLLNSQKVDLDKANLIHMSAMMDSSTIYQVSKGAESLSASVDNLSADDRHKAIQSILESYNQFDTAPFNELPFSAFSDKQRLVAAGFHARLLATLWKIRSASSARDASYWGGIYDRVFNNDSEIDLTTWHKRHFDGIGGEQPNPPGFVMRNIRSDADLKVELEALAKEAKALTVFMNDTIYKNL